MNHWLPIIRFLTIRLAIFLTAVAVTYVLASVLATQAVVRSLAGMGLSPGFGERLSMTVQDLGGMAGMFLPMVAFGLLIAFMTAALICRYKSRWRTPLYILAGAVAVVCIHLGLNLAFGITPVAIARTPGGLLLQGIAGAAGGFTYLALSRKHYRLG
ncbi:hypothetical protein ACFL0N_03885 [Pseudomonadota bacterium]